MENQPNLLIDFSKLLFAFISNNIWPLVSIVVLITCKEAISDFVKRITNLIFRKGKTELRLEAPLATKNQEVDKRVALEQEPTEKDDREVEIQETKDKKIDRFSEMYSAINEGNIDNAKSIFRKYCSEESDDEERYKKESFYLYLIYTKGKERDALSRLEHLTKSAPNETLMTRSLVWLALCYRASNNHEAEIALLEKALPTLKISINHTNCVESLAYAFKADKRSEDGLKLLERRLQEIEEDEEKLILFKATADLEKDLGNNLMSALCKEKAVQLKPDDNDLLFDAAYTQSEASLRPLSICNYSTLITLDKDNSTALNNLGVCSAEHKLEIKAHDYYKQSMELGETLANSNLGYKLLEVGFHEHAEKLAEEGLKENEPHKNLFTLLTKINEKRETENDKWSEIKKKSALLQKKVRLYVDNYYYGTKKTQDLFTGNWFTKDGKEVSANVNQNKISLKWSYKTGLDPTEVEVNIAGSFKNRAAEVHYKTKSLRQPYSILGDSERRVIDCLSYLESDALTWHLFSKSIDDDFELRLYRRTPKAPNADG